MNFSTNAFPEDKIILQNPKNTLHKLYKLKKTAKILDQKDKTFVYKILRILYTTYDNTYKYI